MNCIYCGKQLPEDSEFCVYCGNPIEKAQTPHCSKCGGSVPNDSGFCPYCGTPCENAHNKLDNPKIETSFATMEVGHQNTSVHTKKKKATKKQVLLIILGAVFVLALLGLNVYQLIVNRALEQDLQKQTTQLKDAQSDVRDWKDTAYEYKAKTKNVDEIYDFLSSRSPSYASYLFNASDSIVVMDKNAGTRAVTITTAFNAHVSYSISFRGLAAHAEFAEDTWYGNTTHINITPNFAGTTIITITNDYNNQSIKILVVVTE